MTDFANLPHVSSDGAFLAVIETPRGSSIKYEFEPSLQAFSVSKFLGLGITYPADFGFFPSTRAEDGDPLDLMLFHEAACFPGLVLKVRPISVLEVLQREKGRRVRNDRIIAVPKQADRLGSLTHVKELGRELLREIELFLRATDELQTKKQTHLQGFEGARRRWKADREGSSGVRGKWS
jgi:inorganic pyrophosphatase